MSKSVGLSLTPGSGNDPEQDSDLMPWQEQIKLDMGTHGAEAVVAAIMGTCKFTDDRNLAKEVKTALRWNGYAWWAIPRSLAIVQDELRLIEGAYFRAWVCELDGVKIDGHIYVNEGSGCCQQCGE